VFHVFCLRQTTKKCPLCRAKKIAAGVAVSAGGAIIGAAAALVPIVVPSAFSLPSSGKGSDAMSVSVTSTIRTWFNNAFGDQLRARCQSISTGDLSRSAGYFAAAAAATAGIGGIIAVAGTGLYNGHRRRKG